MSIPYTLEPRSDTRVSNVTLGLWLFLASEVMLFGALFSAYALLRVSAPNWPHGFEVLNVYFGATNTLIFIWMSVVIWLARRRRVHSARRFIVVASLLALVFLVVKGLEYRAEISLGRVPSTSTFMATYFTLTGFHAFHVIAGLIANLWAITGLGRVGEAMTASRIRLLSIYWQFVDIVWLLIFVLLYLS